MGEGRREEAQKAQEGLIAEDTVDAKKRGWRGSARINVDSLGACGRNRGPLGEAAPAQTEGETKRKFAA